MRSNVRKMWTALLAVLFAAAVGFGLWFAFAPAARPASVQAAEEPSVTFTVDSSKTLYSWYPTTGLISNRFITGTIDLADGSTAQNLQAYAEKTTFNIYKQVENEGQTTYQKVSDFRPDAGVSPNSTYTRYIEAVVALDDGRTITSEKKAVMVTADEITSFEASAVGQQTTFYALETVSEERLIVQAMYKNGGMSNILEIPMAQLDEDGKPLYGGWYIVYQQEEGKTEEEDSSKYLEYGDTYFTVYYKEGNQEKDAKVNINVIEAYVNAPVTPSLSNFEYDETPHSNTFTGYDAEKMIYSLSGEGVSASLNEDNFVVSATNVGTYSVTFTVKEGYQFLNTPAGATGTVATRVDGTTYLKSVTYTWKITQASIDRVTVAGNWKDGWTFGTPDAAPSKENVVLNILYEGSSETVTKLPDDVGATVTFYFSGTANDGTSYGPSSTLPTKAGNYSWTVSLTGMNNFEDFTGTDANGGSGSFVIEKKTLSVPALKNTKPDYTGEAQSATATYDSSLMSFDGDLDTESRIDVGVYHATFTLKDPDNYKWADGAAVSGEKDKVATVTWEIIQAENTISDFELAQSSWVWSETAAPSPSATAKFGGGITYKYYSDATLQNEITSPTTWNVGTYYVTATSSSDTSEHKNYTSVRTKAIPFTVSRAPIAQPELSQSEFTYDGTKKTPTLNVSSQYYTFTVEGKTDAGDDYKATVTLDDNHCWENVTGDAATAALELDWKILPAGIGVEGTLSIVGWTYGGYDESANEPGGVTLDDDTNALLGTATATFKYEYKLSSAEDSAYITTVPTDAGDYTVRLTISVNKNFTPYSTTDNFTIDKKTVTVNWTNTQLTYIGEEQTPTATTDDFLNGDDIKLKVSGGQTDAGTSYTATASLSGDDAKNYVLDDSKKSTSFTIAKKSIGIDWGETEFTYSGEKQAPTAEPTGVVNGDTLTLTVSVEGEHTNAGDYTAEASLSGTDAENYSLPDDATIEFVIHKLEVRIQALGQTGRQLEHTGSPLSPSITLIGPDGVQLEGVATQQGFYDSAQSELGSEPSAYGSYYVSWKLNDSTNYAWGAINESDQISGFKDKINGELIYIAYQITGSSYKITISANNWTVGDTLQDLFSVEAAHGYQDRYEAALNEGLTVTYTFLNAAGQQQIGEAKKFTVNAANQNFALTAASIPEGVALNAGTYTLRVEFSESANKNYASAWASATFTVSPYVLKDEDVKWTEPSGLIYKGAEYTFGGKGSNIYATYKTWSYANGVYSATENGDYLTLALTGEAGEILNAGKYTLSASLPENEHAVALPTDAEYAKKPITVSPKEINVTLEEYSETYKGETFSGSFTTNGRSHNGQTLFTIGENGLYGSDTLEGKFTYPENAINAGSYKWGEIEWSNNNYKVTETYEENEAEVFKIERAKITVTIHDQTSAYGDDLAPLTYEITKGNLQGKDTADTIFTLQAQKDEITPLKKGDDARDYKIVGSTTGEGLIDSGNYDVAFSGSGADGETGVYTITQRNLTITVTGSIEYGEDAPTKVADYTVNFSDALKSDEATLKGLLSITAGDYSAGNDKGNYDLTVSGNEGAASDQTWNNYSITYAKSTLTVTPREITVNIQNVRTTYGTAVELKVSVGRGDNKDPIYSGDLDSSGTDTSDPERYENVFQLVLKNAENKVVEHTATLDNGTYSIVLDDNFKNENYNITVTEGTYTVGRYQLGITLSQNLHGDETSPVYDGAAWTYSAKANYTVAGLSGEIDFTNQIVYYERTLTSFAETETPLDGAPVDAGSYWAVLPATAASGNFEPTSQVSTDFTIAQRKVDVEWLVDDVEASGYSLGYNGDTGYSITAQYYGWMDGEQNSEPTSLTVTVPSDFRNVKDYDFTAAFATDAEKGNYKFGDQDDKDSVTQTFSIAQAEITVAIKPQISIYGEKTVDLTVGASKEKETALYTVTGNLYDNANTIFSLSTTATNTSDAQSYQITGTAIGLQNSGNYKVAFVDADDSGVSYGTYTVDRRPVQIALDDFSMIYGTDISARENHGKLVGLSGLSFKLGTGTTGSPFLAKDSDAEAAAKSAMNFAFAGTSGTYGAQSAANTTWTVTASLSDQASDDLKNYTFVAGDNASCTMTVIPRPIKVTLPELGSTSYTYGTAALQKAFLTFKASEALSNDWAGYGEPIVFNDNAEGGVYTLVVKNEDGGVTTLSASTPVGTYTLAGKAGANSNYSVTFTTEQTFSVTEAEFKVNAQDPVSVSVGYTGKNYYFRSDAEAKENPADTYLFNYGLNVTTADFVLSEKDIAFTWGFKVGGNSLTCLTDAGEYTVNYTVTAENFKTVTGSFTVTISQATNKWTAGMTTTDGGAYKQASWTYGDPNVYSSLEWTGTFTDYTPSTPFEAAFGVVKIEYYKARTEAEGGYEYSDQITDPGTFFGFETAVGTYYVKVFVEATKNFTGLTAHGTIVVNQRAVDIDWKENNITVDGETHGGTNTTIGFVNTLMSVDTESLPQGLTIEGKPNESSFTGEITVNVKAEGTTQFYLYFELIDPDNYCWEESATVSGDKGERIQINFTTNALQNNVTFKFKGQDDDPSQNTGISISFGTELTYRFATSSGDTIGSEHLLIFADSTLANETQNYYISFARTTQGDEQPRDDTYSISSLDGADAGYYWLRVQVYPTSDSSYGYGIGYLKICVTQQEITQDDIAGIDFGLSEGKLHFTYDGQEHQPSAEDVPSYLHVTFSGSATNVCEGEVTVTATFTIADKNYKFADGVSPTREITVVIDPYEITHIVWSDREYTYNGTDQKEDVYAYFVDVFGVEHRLRVTAEGGFQNVTADGTKFTALLELYEAQEDFCIQNYKFAEGLAERTHVYKMAKATVEIGIGDAEAVYTGEPIEIDQTQYALRTAISLSDSEIRAFLNQIHLIAVDTEGNPAVNVGEYKIILEKKEWAYTNIEIVFNDSYAGQLTVSPAPLEVPVLDETQFVYNGSVQKPNVTGKDGVYTVANVGGTDVGNYYVTLTLETDNYRWETTGEKFVKLKYEIVQAEYSFSFDVSDTVYNGAPVSVNAPELPAGETGASVAYLFTGMMNGGRVYSNSDAPTEAGSYTLTVTISGMKNYKDAEASAEFTIERAPIKVSITFKQQVEGVSGWENGWVYGTTPKDIYELDKSSNPGQGGVTATYSTGSWSGSAIPTEVGEYTLTVTVAETANYKSGSAKVEFEIVQASEDELSFTVSIKGWTYGKVPHAPSVIWGGGLTGHPDQISPTYTYAPVNEDNTFGKFSSTVPTNAGSYVVKATFAETDHYGELSKMCEFTIDKATALIDTSGVKTNFTYNGRAQALSGAVLNHSEVTLVYSPATVTAVGSYTVKISAAASTNYTAATATVTVTVSRASAGFSVRIDDWTYGETPSRYTISGGSGGSVSVTYSGTTNAGVKYSSSKVPTEAGEYTITVVMGASGNFLGGTARDSFTIHRADAGAELTLAGWAYGETPNSYLLTPEFLREEVIRAVYSDGTYYSEAVPQDVGSYTLTVTYGETDNYLGGEVSCKFSIVPYGLGLTVTLEGWTYGDKANEPIVTGAGGIGLMYAYTGTANDGTMWSSNTAPEKAGSYTLTVTVIEAGNYTGESASTDFVIARRLLSAPAWDEEGMRELIEVCSGDRMTRAILGFDMSLMNAQSATAQFMFDGTGAASVTANIHGVYTIVVSLKDAANYGWADLNEGETLTGPVTLTWTLTERVISLLWLIILLAVLIVIALIVLIVLLKKGGKPDGMDTEEGGKPDGTDTGKSDVRLSSVAPVGLLLVVAPLGEIIAVVVLGVVLAAVVIADIAVGVRNAKRAKAAENAQEPVPAYGDEAAAEGEAYPGTEVPADDGAEVAPDEGGMPE